MDIETLKRYTRQMVLPEIGIDGQQAIQDSHALIIGLGGLGSPVAIYLAAAGIGKITISDFDRVDISNLHRQILFNDNDIGQLKTNVAAAKLRDINPAIEIEIVNEKMELEQLLAQCAAADIVLDCSDNFQTRHLINHAAYRL